jgi:hypothetical protein
MPPLHEEGFRIGGQQRVACFLNVPYCKVLEQVEYQFIIVAEFARLFVSRQAVAYEIPFSRDVDPLIDDSDLV